MTIIIKIYNRFISIPNYIFVTGNDAYERDPVTFDIYGTKIFEGEESEWELITSEVGNYYTTNRKATVRFDSNNYTSSLYEGIKFVVTKIRYSSTYVQLSDFYPAICSAKYCPAENPYPKTIAGSTAVVPCSDGSSKNRKRKCLINGVWDDEEDLSECENIESNIIYPDIPVFKVYDLIDPIIPTINGVVSKIHSDLILPLSLSLNSKTGVISGYIEESLDPGKNFLIIADTPQGKINTTIFIHAIMPTCSDNITHPNEFAYERCDVEESGYKSRLCLPTSPPTWDVYDESKCTSGKSPRCKYEKSEYIYMLGSKLPDEGIKAKCEYEYNKVTIDNALPSGLSFDSNSGIISGICTSPLLKTLYTSL